MNDLLRRIGAAAAAMALFAIPLAAQAPSDDQPVRSVQVSSDDEASLVPNRLSGGLIGAAVGFGLGAWFGYQASSDKPVDQRGFAGLREGLLGSAIAAPIMAHVFAGRRGRLWPSLSLSAGLGIVGYVTESDLLLATAPVYSVVFSVVLH